MAKERSRLGGWLRGLTPSGAKARGSKGTELEEKAPSKPPDSATTETKPAPTETKPAPEEKPTAEAKPAPAPGKPPPDMQGRIDGIQGWMAEIERKQGRMTYFGAAAGVLALAAAGVALFLAITNNNDTSNDIDALRDDLNGVQQQLQQTTDKQLKALNGRLTTLEQQLTSVSQREKQSESDIAQLQSQGAGKKGLGATAPVTPAVPTTPTKP